MRQERDTCIVSMAPAIDTRGYVRWTRQRLVEFTKINQFINSSKC